MPAMLGEMLLKVGALTEVQLQQVLNAQTIYGGRLGTNLVEMGLVDEEELAHALYEQLGVPYVELAALSSVPSELLAVVPLEMVVRYRVLPVALHGKKLTLAMEDPSDFKAIEEIGFVTGLVVVPRVCSELRLSLALERYFRIKRTVRYIPVEGGYSSRLAVSPGSGQSGEEPWRPAAVTRQLPGPAALPQGRLAVASLADCFSRAASEMEAVSALLAYLGAEFDRAAFLRVQRGMVLGVKAVASGEEMDGFAGFSCQPTGGSPLGRLVAEGGLFLGALPEQGAEGALRQVLGGAVPAPGLLVPLSVDGRVAALICVSDQHGRLAGGVFDLQRVAAMAELTLEMIRLKKRIRAC